MSTASSQPHLRLVGAANSPARARCSASQQVARENRSAAMNPALSPTDPRWVLAARAYSQLQGSALSPERRQRIMHTAEHLGVRPFDANVIIAIVQDHARRGEDLAGVAPTLSMLARPKPRRSAASSWLRWIAALAAALMANALLIWWLGAG